MRRLVAVLLLLSALAWAQISVNRVLIGGREYAGPRLILGSDLLLDAGPLATAMGWSFQRHGDAGMLAAVETPLPADAHGLYVAGRAFTGMVRFEDDHVWVRLEDLANFLGGRAHLDPSLGLAEASIPGMPRRHQDAHRDPRALLIAQMQLKPYTLVYFVAPGDSYCRSLEPNLLAFARNHADMLRVVRYDVTKPGDVWFYGGFKTPNNGIPEMVLVNRHGQVLQKLLGTCDTATLERELDSFLK
ncbi:MAG: YbbN family protein [Candidatus Xenobia bacterium]